GGIVDGGGTTTVANTILAANSAPSGANCATTGGGVLASAGHNIESANTCGLGPSDRTGTDPLLGPLDANGGPTRTLALLAGSPAIDGGDASRCDAVDQRRVARPKGAACDIGAYELAPPDAATGTA